MSINEIFENLFRMSSEILLINFFGFVPIFMSSSNEILSVFHWLNVLLTLFEYVWNSEWLKIVEDIINYETIDYLVLREKLYNIFTYNLDLYECIYIIVNTLVEKGYITEDKTEKIFIKMHKFLKLYNNNYRPIYHLESFVSYLCIVIHELH